MGPDSDEIELGFLDLSDQPVSFIYTLVNTHIKSRASVGETCVKEDLKIQR